METVSGCCDCTGKCLHDSLSDTWYSPGVTQLDEGSGQPRNQLQTAFMAAQIPHSTSLSPGFYFHNPNPLPFNQQPASVIADSSALLKSHSAQDLILVDPFWVGPMRLSSLVPPDFPFHIDSIRAESFSRDMTSSYQENLICMLDTFRKKIISAHGGNMKQVPTTLSITKASNFGHIPTQFGVSAPVKNKNKSQSRSQMADLVRSYRVRQCWGELHPPRKSEPWKHGQCAENQSLSSVVAHCADLGLKNVTIHTLAMNKSGKLVGMCGNCRSYVSDCILRKHPTWKVVDGYTIRKSP